MQKFSDFKLSEPLFRALNDLGFHSPTPIQVEAIPLLLQGPTDFLGLAATGTGKTAAFAIPLLEQIQPKKSQVQALILCPTRELALQVSKQIDLLGRYRGVRSLSVYGGSNYQDQLYGLKRGVSIVVGTPGRVVDHLKRRTLDLSELQTLVLDEADEMISMGFQEDLETVLRSVPQGQSKTWLFSATMGSEVLKVAHRYLKNPKKVQVNRHEILPSGMEQIYYLTQESNKPEVLCKLIDGAESFYGIVFCQTKALVVDLQQYLKNRGYGADCLHGDMEQPARDRAMKAFRERKTAILVATDVACRGLDVQDISHVINYSIPRELDHYVHRIGRTGRNGKFGIALSLVTPSHRSLIRRIEKMTQTTIKEGKIPTRKEIATKKIAQSLAFFKAQHSYGRAVELLDDTWKGFVSEMSHEEIIGRFLSLMHPEVFSISDKNQSVRSLPRQKAS